MVTSDGDKIGTVVGEEAGNLIVQTGTLRHHTHAIPRTFVHPDDAAFDPMTREAEEQRVALREGRPGPNDVPEIHERSRNPLDPLGVDSNR